MELQVVAYKYFETSEELEKWQIENKMPKIISVQAVPNHIKMEQKNLTHADAKMEIGVNVSYWRKIPLTEPPKEN